MIVNPLKRAYKLKSKLKAKSKLKVKKLIKKGILTSWTQEEEEKYDKAIKKYGKDWKKVNRAVNTKSFR